MILAYVNFGMWVAECQCKNAIALAPVPGTHIENVEWPKETTVLQCKNCGLTSSIQMPIDRYEIENVLSARPTANQNWWPHETLADLRIENAVHSKELI